MVKCSGGSFTSSGLRNPHIPLLYMCGTVSNELDDTPSAYPSDLAWLTLSNDANLKGAVHNDVTVEVLGAQAAGNLSSR